MKKFFAIIFALVMIFCLVGCGQNNDTSDTSSSNSGFAAPVGYASVVEVKINPTAKLYLDAEGVVLAVEYVNADAETAFKSAENELVGKKVEKTIETMVDIAVDIGYFAGEGKEITVNVVKSVDTVDKRELLEIAVSGVEAALEDADYEVEIKQEIAGTTHLSSNGGEDASSNISSDTASSTSSENISSATSSEVSSAPPPKAQEVVSGAKYMLVKPFEDPEVMTFTVSFDTSAGRCSYSDAPYSYEYGDPNSTMQYDGKTYMQAGGKGGSCEYSYVGEIYTLAEEGCVLKFKLNGDGNLVVTEYNDFFGGMVAVSVGDIFIKK